MLGHLVERLALVLAGLLLGIRVGVAERQVQGARQRGGHGGLHAPGHRFIHVHPVGGVGTELVGAAGADAGRAGDAGDLVLEVVVEHGDVGLQIAAGVEVQPQLLVHRSLRFQVRVAVDVAAPAHLAPVRGDLPQRRRPEAGGHPTLQSPARRHAPHAVQTRAHVAAVVFVVVETDPAGDRDVTRQHPLVLGEQRPFGGVHVGAVGDLVGGPVGQLFFFEVGADGEQVVA